VQVLRRDHGHLQQVERGRRRRGGAAAVVAARRHRAGWRDGTRHEQKGVAMKRREAKGSSEVKTSLGGGACRISLQHVYIWVVPVRILFLNLSR
jgi:hypothetical protein